MVLFFDDLVEFAQEVVVETSILYTEAEARGDLKEREHYFTLFNVYTGILKNIREMRELMLPYFSLALTANNMFQAKKMTFDNSGDYLEFATKVADLQNFISDMEKRIKEARNTISREEYLSKETKFLKILNRS